MKMKNSGRKISDDVRNLVIARLQTMSPKIKISVGAKGVFNRDDLIAHVKKDDAVGKKIVQIELEFLQSLKEGIVV